MPPGWSTLDELAAVAAMMPTASGSLIAAATVARADVVPFVSSWFGRGGQTSINTTTEAEAENPEHDVTANRWWVLGLGLITIALAVIVQDVVAALTIAYAILVGGLLVSILGGLVWKRATGVAAAASMAAGTVFTLGTMIYLEVNAENQYDDIYANDPIYWGLGASAMVFVIVSLLTKRTDPGVMAA